MEGQFRFAREVLAQLEPFFPPEVGLLLTHGNGPQVGHQLDRVERSIATAYAVPLDACVAQTQGEVGYVLAQALRQLLAERGIDRPVASLVTQVEVDPGDAAFRLPSKPVGPFLDPKDAAALRRRGIEVREEAGRGWRRVVPSPEPKRVVEVDVLRQVLALGMAVVAAGGGGIPVVASGRGLRGIEAVVDKDLTAALLADAIDADLLLILTDVPCAYTDFRTGRQAPLGRISARRARELLADGHFAPGSMAPKMEACARFASGRARRAVVCDPPSVAAALRGEAGTNVVPDV
jgi:carbamate kinase